MEIWENINGYEGLYQVSTNGRVKSLQHIDKAGKNRKEKILKPRDNGKGYLTVNLLGQEHKIHRLVAQTFIPNPNFLTCINHKDENKQNNKMDNLEWCDVKYNNNYGNRNYIVTLRNSKKVGQYTMDGILIKEWPSVREAGRKLNIPNQNISRCCNGGRKTCRGYIWRYIND